MDWNLFLAIVVAVGSFIALLISSAIWLSKQFSGVRNLVYDKTEQLKEFIIDKIEYHEKHDDRRFHDLRNDIWAIKLRNATIDGKVVGSIIKEKIAANGD